MLSVTSVAKILGVHPDTIRRWADKGLLPCVRTLGGHRRFRPQDVSQLLNAD